METRACHYCGKEVAEYHTTYEKGNIRNPKTGIFPMIEVAMCEDCAFKGDTLATCDYISEIQPLAG